MKRTEQGFFTTSANKLATRGPLGSDRLSTYIDNHKDIYNPRTNEVLNEGFANIMLLLKEGGVAYSDGRIFFKESEEYERNKPDLDKLRDNGFVHILDRSSRTALYYVAEDFGKHIGYRVDKNGSVTLLNMKEGSNARMGVFRGWLHSHIELQFKKSHVPVDIYIPSAVAQFVVDIADVWGHGNQTIPSVHE